MENLWFFSALAAAALWGVSYAIMGRLFELEIPVTLWLLLYSGLSFPLYLALMLRGGNLSRTGQFLGMHPQIWLYMALSILSGMAANFLIAFSISQKNATVSSLIEISYPFFTLMFAWILFREAHLNWATASGALLIFFGIGIIYLKA
jgi:drug/metabolite transporter (DMT)-like permease